MPARADTVPVREHYRLMCRGRARPQASLRNLIHLQSYVSQSSAGIVSVFDPFVYDGESPQVFPPKSQPPPADRSGFGLRVTCFHRLDLMPQSYTKPRCKWLQLITDVPLSG